MRIVLFCENKYAVDILLPIYQEAVKSETNHILWYVHLPKIPVFPLDGKVVYTYSMQEVYDFSPEAIFVPGNIVPYYLPGGTPCYFRVSHLGVQSEEDLDDLAMRIKEIEYR